MHVRKGSITFIVITVIIAAAVLGAAGFWLYAKQTPLKVDANAPHTLTQQELVDAVRPSVVMIVQHDEGDATVPAFDLDLKNLAIIPLPKKPAMTSTIDEYVEGSGFVVNSAGYILTNSHVISDATIKNAIIGKIFLPAILKATLAMNATDLKAMQNRTEDEGVVFAKSILEYAEKNGSFNIKKTITVLNPASQANTLPTLVKDGFPATVVSVNDNFTWDEKDAGLIKIGQSNLPALTLGTSANIATGQKISIFGFPANAELNSKSILEPTFTQGVINAVKDSRNKDFKIFQTDAKVSEGSSGSPTFDGQGTVFGITTFESSLLASGDNFAFAIPIEIAKAVLNNASVANEDTAYSPHLMRGLSLLEGNHCKTALQEFSAAAGANNAFGAKEHVDPYVAKCNAIIAAGASIDTKWDAIRASLGSVGYPTWLIGAGIAIATAGLILVVFWLLRRMKKEEKEIVQLEHDLREENLARGGSSAMSGTMKNSALPPLRPILQETRLPATAGRDAVQAAITAPTSPTPNLDPILKDYVRGARMSGMSDDAIMNDLKSTGWQEDKIKDAMKG